MKKTLWKIFVAAVIILGFYLGIYLWKRDNSPVYFFVTLVLAARTIKEQFIDK